MLRKRAEDVEPLRAGVVLARERMTGLGRPQRGQRLLHRLRPLAGRKRRNPGLRHARMLAALSFRENFIIMDRLWRPPEPRRRRRPSAVTMRSTSSGSA